jgi:hypothetical protein
MATATKELNDLFVCVDCGFYIAYGEVENPDPRWNEKDAGARWDGYVVVNGDSDKDHEFSWSPCEYCGSTLGGTRMHCVAWER